MNKSQKIWLGISIGIVVFFLWGIPLGAYAPASFMYSGLGAILLFISLFQLFGQFTTLDEIFQKQDKSITETPGRKLAPFMVIPAFIFLFVSFFYFSHKKSNALESNGVLTKGVVLNGESKSTTRRMRTTTSYEIQAQFTDSLGAKYYFDESVSSDEFNDVYKGAPVDIVYWRENPDIAKVVFNIEELGRYKKIPNEHITINSLTAILEGNVQEDSIKDYLNTINYEWVYGPESMTYENVRLKQAVRYTKQESTIVFVETNNMMGYVSNAGGKPAFSFEKDLIEKGYKKQASSGEDGEALELYYSDNYIIQKTTRLENTGDGGMGLSSYSIYLITKGNKE